HAQAMRLMAYRSFGLSAERVLLKQNRDCLSHDEAPRPTMTGRARLPAGEPRKASQKRMRRGAATPLRINPIWNVGDRVSWGGRFGSFVRNLNDGIHAEIRIEQRTYRVRIADLRPG